MNSISKEVVDLQISAADNLTHLLHLRKIMLLLTLIKNKSRNIRKKSPVCFKCFTPVGFRRAASESSCNTKFQIFQGVGSVCLRKAHTKPILSFCVYFLCGVISKHQLQSAKTRLLPSGPNLHKYFSG